MVEYIMTMSQNDYYRTLNVDQKASPRQIKEAYRKLAFKYHPDRNTEDPDAAEKMKRVNEAYAVLSNPAKRKEYDVLRQQFGSAAYSQFRQNYSEQDIFSGSDINQIFEQMARASDLRGVEEIFKEFYGQGYQNYEFRKPGVFTRGWVFTGTTANRTAQQPRFPFKGNVGKVGGLISFLEEAIPGLDFFPSFTLTWCYVYLINPTKVTSFPKYIL